MGCFAAEKSIPCVPPRTGLRTIDFVARSLRQDEFLITTGADPRYQIARRDFKNAGATRRTLYREFVALSEAANDSSNRSLRPSGALAENRVRWRGLPRPRVFPQYREQASGVIVVDHVTSSTA